MKILYLSLALLLAGTICENAVASEPRDTTAKELKEVVVEGKSQYVTKEGTVYIPSRNQRKASRNANDLIRHIGIPQLNVDARTDNVTTLSGEGVAYFVNGKPARGADIEGIWTMEVKKVEFMESPSDPAFMGERNVVNFIVQEYEYGGYTRLGLQETAISNYQNVASLFSRFSYKKMTFDVFAKSVNRHERKGWTETSQKVHIPGYTEIERAERLDDGSAWYNYVPLTFSAAYSSGGTYIRNDVSFSFDETDNLRRNGTVSIRPSAFGPEKATTVLTSRDRSLYWHGTFIFPEKNGWNFSMNTEFSYAHNNSNSTYETPVINIDNIALENAVRYYANLSLSKRFGNHRFGLDIEGGGRHNKVTYRGTNPSVNRLSTPDVDGRISYGLSAGDLYLSADAMLLWHRKKINDITKDHIYPIAHLNLNYTPGRNNRISFFAQYAESNASMTQSTEAVVRLDELMFATGNPYLEYPKSVDLQLSYTWFPNNMFTASAYGLYELQMDRVSASYTAYDGSSVLRSFTNDGNYHKGEIGVSLTCRLLNRHLQLSVTPKQTFHRTTGRANLVYNPFVISANVYYYTGPFYVNAYYSTPQKNLNAVMNETKKSRPYYHLSAGWGNGNWNLSLYLVNIFNWGWKQYTFDLVSDVYSSHKTVFGSGSRACVQIGATYTFGYGKKINRNQEAGANSAGESAIIR